MIFFIYFFLSCILCNFLSQQEFPSVKPRQWVWPLPKEQDLCPERCRFLCPKEAPGMTSMITSGVVTCKTVSKGWLFFPLMCKDATGRYSTELFRYQYWKCHWYCKKWQASVLASSWVFTLIWYHVEPDQYVYSVGVVRTWSCHALLGDVRAHWTMLAV